MKIDLIIPCYNEEEALPFLYPALAALAEKEKAHSMRFLFIDDGSRDNTLPILKEFALNDERVQYYSFSRNFGKEAAMLCGMTMATGDAVGILDADMQHPPALISEMITALEEGYDVAAAKRSVRQGQPGLYQWGARMFYRLSNRLSDVQLPQGAQDFRLMRKKVVDAIVAMPEYHRFSKGIFAWVGFKTKWIEHHDAERVAGTTKWNFFSSFHYAIEGIVSFSTKPLTAMVGLGAFISLIGFLYALFIVIEALVKGVRTPGFPTLASLILILSGITILSVGLAGLYISKTYMEVKRRPHFIVSETNDERTLH